MSDEKTSEQANNLSRAVSRTRGGWRCSREVVTKGPQWMIHENLVRLHVLLGFPFQGIKVNGVCLYKTVHTRQDLPFVCLSLCILSKPIQLSGVKLLLYEKSRIPMLLCVRADEANTSTFSR